MNSEKVKAISRFILNVNTTALEKWCNANGMHEPTLKDIVDYMLGNGDCGFPADITEHLEKWFVDFVFNHSLVPMEGIKNAMKGDNSVDFLMDDWNDIYEYFFPSIPYFQTIVFGVVEHYDMRHIDPDKETTIFSSYENAKACFQEKRSHLFSKVKDNDNWEIETDIKDNIVIQSNCFEEWFDLSITKMVVH